MQGHLTLRRSHRPNNQLVLGAFRLKRAVQGQYTGR